MKLVFQALLTSAAIHVLYFLTVFLIDFAKTRNHTLDIEKYEDIEYLQNEVAYGFILSPYLLAFTLIGGTIICGFLLFLYKKRL